MGGEQGTEGTENNLGQGTQGKGSPGLVLSTGLLVSLVGDRTPPVAHARQDLLLLAWLAWLGLLHA